MRPHVSRRRPIGCAPNRPGLAIDIAGRDADGAASVVSAGALATAVSTGYLREAFLCAAELGQDARFGRAGRLYQGQRNCR
jgi:hypothetical protein